MLFIIYACRYDQKAAESNNGRTIQLSAAVLRFCFFAIGLFHFVLLNLKAL